MLQIHETTWHRRVSLFLKIVDRAIPTSTSDLEPHRTQTRWFSLLNCGVKSAIGPFHDGCVDIGWNMKMVNKLLTPSADLEYSHCLVFTKRDHPQEYSWYKWSVIHRRAPHVHRQMCTIVLTRKTLPKKPRCCKMEILGRMEKRNNHGGWIIRRGLTFWDKFFAINISEKTRKSVYRWL